MSNNQSGFTNPYYPFYRQNGQGFQMTQGATGGFQTAQPGGGAGFQTMPTGFPQGFGFPQTQIPTTTPAQVNPAQFVPGMLPLEQSYIENILRLNKGKLATVYMAFEGSTEWNSKIFKGIIEAAGRDHLILSDPETGYRYLLPMVYFNYAVFDEELEYEYPFGNAPMTTYSPR